MSVENDKQWEISTMRRDINFYVILLLFTFTYCESFVVDIEMVLKYKIYHAYQNLCNQHNL